MKSGPKHKLSNIALRVSENESIQICTTEERKIKKHDLSGGHGNPEITLHHLTRRSVHPHFMGSGP